MTLILDAAQRIDKELASAISQLDSEKEDALKNLDEQASDRHRSQPPRSANHSAQRLWHSGSPWYSMDCWHIIFGFCNLPGRNLLTVATRRQQMTEPVFALSAGGLAPGIRLT